ncbi:M56 family metallopeptidase [Paenibacillus sp. EC2-1]|uniref:M56 family metallopeptidase n=1 Tax=Paenibacillus sp. EC2-1 TaxID=3388665 RepID=UPI003BEEB66D
MFELFLTTLNMSLTASYVILFVILARFLLKKAPKIISYALWSAAAFRLVFPFSFESMFSLFPRGTDNSIIPDKIIQQSSPLMDSGITAVSSLVRGTFPAVDSGTRMDSLLMYAYIGAYIWIVGAAVLLLYSVGSVVILKRKLKYAEWIEHNIYEARNLKTPFVLGLIRPKIYLPMGMSADEKKYILFHEQTHIRRKDHIIKALAFIILSFHWFNPLVWIAFILMSMDMELSCDEQVLKKLDADVKKPYAASLLSLAVGKHIMNGSPLAFGEGSIKARIKNVLKYKQPRLWVTAFSVIFVIAIGIGLIANPKTTILKAEESLLPEKTEVHEELWKAHTPYIGNASAVGKLISLLTMPSDVEYDHMELKTSERPYEVKIVYSASSEVLNAYDTEGANVSRPFFNNALILLALIDNADGVQVTLTDGNREVNFTYGLEWANSTVGEDIKNYAETPEKLKELINLEPAQRNVDKISSYLMVESKRVFSPYYELQNFIISDYKEETIDGIMEATFTYTINYKNYDKDPDTVKYIKDAKESGSKHYQQLYDEYLETKEMNFYFKVKMDKDGGMTLFSADPAIKDSWDEVKMSDFIIK